MVMPPATDLSPDGALDQWSTVVQLATALHDHAGAEVMVACRTQRPTAARAGRDGVAYWFDPSDGALVERVHRWAPDVVHVHGLGFTRLTLRLGRSLRGGAVIVLQHHGEPPADRRGVLAHRIVRRFVAGYLFTGAQHGQARPFVECGQIDPHAPVFDVLEAASTLPMGSPAVDLAGDPVVLWVGRLIESKDPSRRGRRVRRRRARTPRGDAAPRRHRPHPRAAGTHRDRRPGPARRTGPRPRSRTAVGDARLVLGGRRVPHDEPPRGGRLLPDRGDHQRVRPGGDIHPVAPDDRRRARCNVRAAATSRRRRT